MSIGTEKTESPIHLRKEELINLGSFYTSDEYVEIVWNFIRPLINSNTVVFDPACGYGAFLKEKTIAKKIGNDIDKKAIEKAKLITGDVIYFNYNALTVLSRETYGIKDSDRLIIIGNPPYNDTTSQAKKRVKRLQFQVEEKLKTRDIGISFLRLFYYLKADYVCILHPLSYLIKRANFRLLKPFNENYILKDGVIISSRVFKKTSKSSEFPIIIALYEKNRTGMDYEYIRNYKFKTIEGKVFRLSDYDYIGNYINKYPRKSETIRERDLLFYTLRDINALKRNRTFLHKPTSNAVRINPDQLDFYVYVDVFKDFINVVPYYFGNMDILINLELFKKYRKYFISYALKKWEFLSKHYQNQNCYDNDIIYIKQYFKELLKEHYVEDSGS